MMTNRQRVVHAMLTSLLVMSSSTEAWAPNSISRSMLVTRESAGVLFAKGDEKGEEEAWDANVDYDKEWPKEQGTPDPATSWDALPNMPDNPKLGIDISLEPLSQEQADEIKKEAKEIISSAIDEGIEDIEKLRKRMSKDLEQSRKIMQVASELKAQQKSEELMNKIDKMTGDFLDSTKAIRSSTKTAAAASRAMEGKEIGIEMGTWGTLGGRTVIASPNGSLLGSMDNAVQQQSRAQTSGKTEGDSASEASNAVATSNRILIIADVKQDKLAKQLVPALERRFEKTEIPNIEVEVLPPTAAMPLGGKDAACVLTFCTSLTQASSLNSVLDKLLRKTLQANGSIGQPPTQLVAISNVGTERTDKFPYSLSNMLGNLDKRRQIEEVVINTVQKRVTEPPLDYTLIKLAELKENSAPFELRPGDSLDDATTVDTAAQAIVQAIAYQPFARNSTLSITGSIPQKIDDGDQFWDRAFLCLEGPELLRMEDVGDVSMYGQILEYIQGWAEILADSGKGLTTPVRAGYGVESKSSYLMDAQDGVQLLFLPTMTGKNYMSKGEERELEEETGKKPGSSGPAPGRKVQEGGIEVLVEITEQQRLRVRARRCNYAYDAVIKELSEQTILKRLEDAMEVWKQDNL